MALLIKKSMSSPWSKFLVFKCALLISCAPLHGGVCGDAFYTSECCTFLKMPRRNTSYSTKLSVIKRQFIFQINFKISLSLFLEWQPHLYMLAKCNAAFGQKSLDKLLSVKSPYAIKNGLIKSFTQTVLFWRVIVGKFMCYPILSTMQVKISGIKLRTHSTWYPFFLLRNF